jgi:hypothetical protein
MLVREHPLVVVRSANIKFVSILIPSPPPYKVETGPPSASSLFATDQEFCSCAQESFFS